MGTLFCNVHSLPNLPIFDTHSKVYTCNLSMGTIKKRYIYVFTSRERDQWLSVANTCILLSVVVLCYSKHELLRSCWDCQLT